MPISPEAHTVKQFDIQLNNLRSMVLEMGKFAAKQLEQAIHTLSTENYDIARETILKDRVINGLQIKASEECINIIALRQPLGSDLRLIMSLASIITDLERIGDGAKKIARMMLHIYTNKVGITSNSDLLKDVQIMANTAKKMLNNCLNTLDKLDVASALIIINHDNELDREFHGTLRKLITYMMEDPCVIERAIDVVFIIKALERIGDHCKNIAEHTVYLVEGENIKSRRNTDMNTVDALVKDVTN